LEKRDQISPAIGLGVYQETARRPQLRAGTKKGRNWGENGGIRRTASVRRSHSGEKGKLRGRGRDEARKKTLTLSPWGVRLEWGGKDFRLVSGNRGGSTRPKNETASEENLYLKGEALSMRTEVPKGGTDEKMSAGGEGLLRRASP